jgi:hypothetical protein
MKDNFSLFPMSFHSDNDVKELAKFNVITRNYGLSLSNTDILELLNGRKKALSDTGRIEFEGGVLGKLIQAFYGSPYLAQDTYTEILYDLQEAFYYFKNESQDMISDDEIIEHMRTYFDNYAQGSTEYLIGTSLEELCRYARDSSFIPDNSDVFNPGDDNEQW